MNATARPNTRKSLIGLHPVEAHERAMIAEPVQREGWGPLVGLLVVAASAVMALWGISSLVLR